MTTVIIVSGFITAIGTAVLTVTAVWKLLQGPILKAINDVGDGLDRLEVKVEAMDSRHQNDIKALWRHLAERKSA